MIKKSAVLCVFILFCSVLIFDAAVRAEDIILDGALDVSGNKVCGAPDFHDETLNMVRMQEAGLLPKADAAPAWGPKAAPVIGTTYSFNVVDNGIWDVIYAKHVAVNANAYVYVQTLDRNSNAVFEGSGGIGTGYITQADADAVASEFATNATNIYTATRSVFGNEPAQGLDLDSHVHILLLDIDSDFADYQDAGSPTTPDWWYGYTAGYFYSVDTLTEGQAWTLGLHSNERKIIYIDTYPTMEHGKFTFTTPSSGTLDATPTTSHDDDVGGTLLDEGADASYSTIAHEFQHMIHYEQDSDEETWLNEGCAGFSEFINGYGIPTQVGSFIANPGDSLINWGQTVTDYGNTFLFILYLYEQSGELNSTITNLVADGTNGTTSISTALSAFSTPIALSDFFKNWLVANYFDDSNLGAKYAYSNVTISNYSTGDTRDGIDPTTGSTTGSGSAEAYSAEYIAIAYEDLPVINFLGAGFAPVIVGLNGTSGLPGSIQNVTTDTNVELSDFGGTGTSSYQNLIIVAANTSTVSSAYSYEFSAVSTGGGGGGGGGGCFVATASYGEKDKAYGMDRVIKYLNELID